MQQNQVAFLFCCDKGCRHQRAGNDPLGFRANVHVEGTDT